MEITVAPIKHEGKWMFFVAVGVFWDIPKHLMEVDFKLPNGRFLYEDICQCVVDFEGVSGNAILNSSDYHIESRLVSFELNPEPRGSSIDVAISGKELTLMDYYKYHLVQFRRDSTGKYKAYIYVTSTVTLNCQFDREVREMCYRNHRAFWTDEIDILDRGGTNFARPVDIDRKVSYYQSIDNPLP